MRRSILPILALLTLAAIPFTTACVDEDCGKIISVSPSVTENEGLVYNEACYDTNPTTGAIDYAPCCPDGFEFLAYSSEGVLCQAQCGLGSTAAVDEVGATVFVVHAVADATLEAVEELAVP